jgi:hypothetical protein
MIGPLSSLRLGRGLIAVEEWSALTPFIESLSRSRSCCQNGDLVLQMGVVVVRKKQLFTLSIVAAVFVLGCASAFLAVAMPTGVHSGNPTDAAIPRGNGEGSAMPRDDVRSSHSWAGGFEQQREKETSIPSSPGRSVLDRARQVLNSPRAGKVLAHCRARGMFELPEQAFAASNRGGVPEPGRGSGRSFDSDFLVVPMTDPRGDRFATALVYREDDGSVMAITVDTATNELTNVISPEGERELTGFNRKKWADCFLSICAPCIAGCAFTGPLWLKCTAACCGVGAVVCVYMAMQE